MAIKLRIGAREVEIGAAETTIGREECDVTIEDDDELSRRHAAVRALSGGGAEVTDLGSRNGTFVDGQRIEGARAITGGETIRVGQTEIATEAVPDPAGATKVSGSPPPPPPPSPSPPPPQFGPPGGSPPPPKAKRGGPPLGLLLGVGAVVLVVVALAAWYFLIRETAEEQIDATVERIFVTADADACDFFTDGFFEEAGEAADQTPEEAEQECRDAEVTASDTATVNDLQIDGDSASGTVEYATEGTVQTVDVDFADEDGWKISAIDFESVETISE